MAIGFARMEFVKRSAGKNACAKAAYNGRTKIQFQGTEFAKAQLFNWSNKEPATHHEIVLPDHVDEKYNCVNYLWNEVEKIENRINSQVAMELVLALPDDESISIEDRVELTKSFVKENFISRAFGAQINIHSPEKDEDGEEKAIKNWHAHVLVTPRRFQEDGKSFETKKPRDLLEVKKGRVTDGPEWGKMWTHHQNQYFEEKGLSLRVDSTGIISQKHLGPVRMRARAFSLMEVNSIQSSLNTIESLDPKSLLKKISETHNIFTREDVERYLIKHLDSNLISDVRKSFWEQTEILQLFDKEKKEPQNKFTTQEILAEEKKIFRIAERMNGHSAFSLSNKEKIETVSATLQKEQLSAFQAIISGKRLSCIEGLAGTGKSYLLAAIKDAYTDEGYIVRGFGPDNATAQVLEKCGITESVNVYRFLYNYHYSNIKINSGNEVWIIDEAGKLGSEPFLELLKAAEQNKVQVILSGDTRQLPSVSRGRIFKGLIDRFGSQFLGDIQRQKYQEQREIAKKLATGKISEALDAISRTGGFRWSETQSESIEKLVKQWVVDQERFPYSPTLILAHTNAEVKVLNEFIRAYRKEKGELGEKEYFCDSFTGKVYISQGDHIEFRKNDGKLGVTNGLKGILINASEDKFVVSVKQQNKVREITFNPQEYTSYQLGYATTNYRSQGDSADRVYVLLSKQMNREMFYVAHTRHARAAYCFVSKTETKNLQELKKQIFKTTSSELVSDFLTQAEIIKQSESLEKYEELDALRSSTSMTKRLKGEVLNLVDKIQNNVSTFVEKHTDRLPNQGFFNHQANDTSVKGSVVEVKDALEKESNSTSNPQTLIKSMLSNKDEESLSVEGLQKGNKESKKWNSLSVEVKAVVKQYYEASDNASCLYSIVKSESESLGKDEKAATHYNDWQMACAQRNEGAYRLTHSLHSKEIASVFSKKSLEILKDRAERHEATLNKQNAPHLEESLKDNLDSLLFRLFPEGPTRRDSRGYRFGNKGSLSVICQGERIGSFYNHEKKHGGGLIRLIEDNLSVSKEDAVHWAKNFLGEAKTLPTSNHFKLKSFESKNDDAWVSLKPNENIKAPALRSISKRLDQQYNEAARHAYRDSSGNLLFYTLRLVDKEDASKKAILPLSYGYYREVNPLWDMRGFKSGKNSLYNLDLIYQRPDAKILIVEGEKTADAANKLFEKDNILAVTWHGGAAASKKSDWSPLFLRDVIIWPDNDASGFKAADSISADLRRIGVNSLKVVNKQALQKTFPEKWDLADALPQGKKEQDIRDLILSAEDKAIGLGTVLSGKPHSLKELLQAREVLWRVDERLRAQLESKHGGKTWEIQNAIATETSSILAREKESIQRMQKAYGIDSSLSEKLSFAEMIFQAKHGKLPERHLLDELRQTIGNIEVTQTENFSKMPHEEKSVVDFIRSKHVAECFENGIKRNMSTKDFETSVNDLLYATRKTTEKQVKTKSLDRSLDKDVI